MGAGSARTCSSLRCNFTGPPPNGLELSCPAEAGSLSSLYVTPAGQASSPESAARRVSFSELLGAHSSSWDREPGPEGNVLDGLVAQES
jgi:hypothetical protein